MGLREVTDRFINVSFVPGAERKAREKAAMTTIAMTMNGEMGKMWKSMNICYGDNGVVLGGYDGDGNGERPQCVPRQRVPAEIIGGRREIIIEAHHGLCQLHAAPEMEEAAEIVSVREKGLFRH